MKFAKVIVDISLDKIDRPFDYIIPENLESKIQAGTPVIIPFWPDGAPNDNHLTGEEGLRVLS